MRASIKPLAAAGVGAVLVAAVPIMMTTLLAARSNRPRSASTRPPLSPSRALLQFAVCRSFGAMGPDVEYWAPQS
jgi:hypothetical protein